MRLKAFFIAALMLFFIAHSLIVQAQEKPIEKMNKKELKALLAQKQQELYLADSLDRLHSQQRNAMNAQLALELTKSSTLQVQLDSVVLTNASLQKELEDLKKAYEQMKANPPKAMDVYDLYSFGYLPFQNSEVQYQKSLEEARQKLQKARLANLNQMVRMLNSSKVSEAEKDKIFKGFKETYKGYLDQLSLAQLKAFDANVEEAFKKGVNQKTLIDIEHSSKENRWIQLLEH